MAYKVLAVRLIFFVCFLYQMTKRVSLKFYKQKKVHQAFQVFIVFSGHNYSFRIQNTFTQLHQLTEGLSIPKKMKNNLNKTYG